jgi:hypothetical protein
MFQFPPYASHGYFTHHGITGCYSCGVSPFGHMRVNALLAAHRTLSWPVRPSSPACPKASISCPESLIMILITLFPKLSVSLLFAYSQISEVATPVALQTNVLLLLFALLCFLFSSAIRLKDS